MPSILRFLTAVFVVALVPTWVGCENADSIPSANLPDHDDALRAFLGIRSLRGQFKLPATTKGYYPVALIFENGEEVSRTVGPMIGLGDHSETVSGEIQLLMSAKDRRALLFYKGNTTELGSKIDWAQFGSAAAWGGVPVGSSFRYQDVSVRAVFATGPDMKSSPSLRLTNEFPQSGVYVIAIGFVYDDDFEVLRKKFDAESAYRPPGKSKAETQPK